MLASSSYQRRVNKEMCGEALQQYGETLIRSPKTGFVFYKVAFLRVLKASRVFSSEEVGKQLMPIIEWSRLEKGGKTSDLVVTLVGPSDLVGKCFSGHPDFIFDRRRFQAFASYYFWWCLITLEFKLHFLSMCPMVLFARFFNLIASL